MKKESPATCRGTESISADMVNSPHSPIPAQPLHQLHISKRRITIFLSTIAVLILGALVLLWIFQFSDRAKVRSMLAYEVKLNDQDEWIDWKSSNHDEPRLHCHLRLSDVTYQSFCARISAEGRLYDSSTPYRWPWPVPTDAIQFERGGSVYAFSPSARIAFVGIWND